MLGRTGVFVSAIALIARLSAGDDYSDDVGGGDDYGGDDYGGGYVARL